jgi:iron(III) transport system permease protein
MAVSSTPAHGVPSGQSGCAQPRWRVGGGWFLSSSRVLLSLLGAILVGGPLAAIGVYALQADPASSVLADTRFGQAVGNTVIVTAWATLTAALLSIPMAWAISRAQPLRRWLWDNISLLPAVVPPLVGAVGWLVLLSPRVGIANTMLTELGFEPITILGTSAGIGIIIGIYQAPFMFTAIRGSLSQVSASYEQAARVFGTRELAAFVGITLPLIRASLISATLAVVMRSLANIGVPLILGQNNRIYVLSNLLFSYVFAEGNMSSAAQLGLLFMATAAILYGLQVHMLRHGVVSTLQVRQARSEASLVTRSTRFVAYAILVLYALLALVLPLVGVLYLSLTPFWNPYVLEAVYTLANYARVLSNSIAQDSVRTTLVTSIVGSVLAVAIAALLSLHTTRSGSLWDRINGRLLMVPLGIPPLVFGLGVLFTVIRLPGGIYGTIGAVIWAFVAYWVAFAQQAVEPFFRQIPRTYDEAAAIAGDSLFERFTNILLPMLGPNLFLVGGLLFLNMMTDLPLVIFLNAPGSSIMPAQLYGFWSQALPVLAAAFAVEMILIALLSAGGILWFRDRWFHYHTPRAS